MNLVEIAASAGITITKDLTAPELELLLVKLMKQRSLAEPAVHPMPPTAADADIRTPVVVQKDPDIRFAALVDGGIRLWLRHVGIGWIPVQFSIEKSRLFRDYLVKWVPGTAPINLIDNQLGGGDLIQ